MQPTSSNSLLWPLVIKYFRETVLRPSLAAPGGNCRLCFPLLTPLLLLAWYTAEQIPDDETLATNKCYKLITESKISIVGHHRKASAEVIWLKAQVVSLLSMDSFDVNPSPSNTWFLGPTLVSPPPITSLPIQPSLQGWRTWQTDRHTDRPHYSVGINKPHHMRE